MSLEDVFVAIVDQTVARTEAQPRYERRVPVREGRKARPEQEIAKTITQKKIESDGGEHSALFGDDEDDN